MVAHITPRSPTSYLCPPQGAVHVHPGVSTGKKSCWGYNGVWGRSQVKSGHEGHGAIYGPHAVIVFDNASIHVYYVCSRVLN
jgi:hypothetical protein